MNFSYKTSIKSPKYEVVFEETTPPGHVERWGESARAPFITIKLHKKEGVAARFTEKDFSALVALAASVAFIEDATIEDLEVAVKNFYETYGPVFGTTEVISLYELRRRMAIFLFTGLLWNVTFPAAGQELMEQRRMLAAFFNGLDTSASIDKQLIPESLPGFMEGRLPFFIPAQAEKSFPGQSPVFLNENAPDVDAHPEKKAAWLQKTIIAYVTKILSGNTTIKFSADKNGNISIAAVPKNIYTLGLLTMLSKKNEGQLHKCPGCGKQTARKNYCSPTCRRKHSPGFAKQRVLSIFRTRKFEGKITPKEYEKLKRHANKMEFKDEQGLKTAMEQYLMQMRKAATSYKPSPGK